MNAIVSQAPMPIQPLAGFRKFTVEQYHKMIRTGVLFEGEAIELLEGYLVNKIHKTRPILAASLASLHVCHVACPTVGFFAVSYLFH